MLEREEKFPSVLRRAYRNPDIRAMSTDRAINQWIQQRCLQQRVARERPSPALDDVWRKLRRGDNGCAHRMG